MEISSAEAHLAEPPRDKTAYRMQPNNWRGKASHKRPSASAGTSGIYRCVPPTHEYGTRPFSRWARSLGRSPHASGKAKNTFDPIGIPLFGAYQAPGNKLKPKWVKAWEMAPWGRRKSPVPRHTRQNRPEIRRPTECNPTTGEERPHTNALERPRGPLIFALPEPFFILKKGKSTPVVPHE